jgi:hypothetical protein
MNNWIVMEFVNKLLIQKSMETTNIHLDEKKKQFSFKKIQNNQHTFIYCFT